MNKWCTQSYKWSLQMFINSIFTHKATSHAYAHKSTDFLTATYISNKISWTITALEKNTWVKGMGNSWYSRYLIFSAAQASSSTQMSHYTSSFLLLGYPTPPPPTLWNMHTRFKCWFREGEQVQREWVQEARLLGRPSLVHFFRSLWAEMFQAQPAGVVPLANERR